MTHPTSEPRALTPAQMREGMHQAVRIINSAAGYRFGGDLIPFDEHFKALALRAIAALPSPDVPSRSDGPHTVAHLESTQVVSAVPTSEPRLDKHQACYELIEAICKAGNHAFLPASVLIPLNEMVDALQTPPTTAGPSRNEVIAAIVAFQCAIETQERGGHRKNPAVGETFDALLRLALSRPAGETAQDRTCDEKHPFGGCDCPAVPAGETRDEPLWAGRIRWMAAHSADFCYMTTMSAQLSKGGGIHSVEDNGTKIGVRVPKSDDYGYEVYDAPTIAEAIDKAARETKHQPVVAYTAVQLSPALPPSHAGEAP